MIINQSCTFSKNGNQQDAVHNKKERIRYSSVIYNDWYTWECLQALFGVLSTACTKELWLLNTWITHLAKNYTEPEVENLSYLSKPFLPLPIYVGCQHFTRTHSRGKSLASHWLIQFSVNESSRGIRTGDTIGFGGLTWASNKSRCELILEQSFLDNTFSVTNKDVHLACKIRDDPPDHIKL